MAVGNWPVCIFATPPRRRFLLKEKSGGQTLFSRSSFSSDIGLCFDQSDKGSQLPESTYESD